MFPSGSVDCEMVERTGVSLVDCAAWECCRLVSRIRLESLFGKGRASPMLLQAAKDVAVSVFRLDSR